MKKTVVLYGSSTGTTKSVAEKIAGNLGLPDVTVKDVSSVSPSEASKSDVLILGSSTWNSGELQEDWYDLITGLEELYLADKTIALFGCGDENMPETFCNAVGILYDRLQKTGARFIGEFNTDGYEFSKSEAVKNGKAVGLLIDDVNREDLTDKRIKDWCDKIKKEM